MLQHSIRLFVTSAIATLMGATAASAGCCPMVGSPCACAPMVLQQVVAPPVEMYIVNQGPVYSGPGPYVTQRNYIEGDQTAPYGYPPVGFVPADTYGPGYRGFYSGSYYPPYGAYHRARYRAAHVRSHGLHRGMHPGSK